MIVDVCLVGVIGLVQECSFQCLNALLELFKGIVRKAETVQDLRITIVDLQSCGEVSNSICVQSKLIVTLCSVHQELCVLVIFIYGCVEEGKGFIVVS